MKNGAEKLYPRIVVLHPGSVDSENKVTNHRTAVYFTYGKVSFTFVISTIIRGLSRYRLYTSRLFR